MSGPGSSAGCERIFLELGRRLHDRGLLHEPRDIFFLEFEEIFGFVEGTPGHQPEGPGVRCAGRNIDEYRAVGDAGRPDRNPRHRLPWEPLPLAGMGGRTLTDPIASMRQGLGCCPGMASGRTRVMTDPAAAPSWQGDILVAERTDPGWIMLFPAGRRPRWWSAAVLLSHSAIVAREMGIPAVVGSRRGSPPGCRPANWCELTARPVCVRKLTGERKEEGS